MSQAIFAPYAATFTSTYGLAAVQEALTDDQHQCAVAIAFYFPGKR